MELVPIPDRLYRRVEQLVQFRPTDLLFVRDPVVKARVARRRHRQILVGLRAVQTYVRVEERLVCWLVPAEVAQAFEVAEAEHPEAYAYAGPDAWMCPGFRAAFRAGTSPGWGAAFVAAVSTAGRLGGDEAKRALVVAELPPFWRPDPELLGYG